VNGWWRRGAAATALVLLTGGCMTPARGESGYAGKAKQALTSAASETASVQLTISTLLRGNLLAGYADQTVSQSEDALDSIASQFASVQPPATPAADKLQATMSTLFSDASDAVESARIAMRRADRAGMKAAVADLGKQTERLTVTGDRL
jgi:hypothetical protein